MRKHGRPQKEDPHDLLDHGRRVARHRRHPRTWPASSRRTQILWHAWSSPIGSKTVWAIGAITALMTAFYMWRLMYMTFWGENRADEETQKHIHESPRSMTVPLQILAIGSILGGWISVPDVFPLRVAHPRRVAPARMGAHPRSGRAWHSGRNRPGMGSDGLLGAAGDHRHRDCPLHVRPAPRPARQGPRLERTALQDPDQQVVRG